jgi:pyruvate dehydrogenase E2 component (dihydrolipoamide acetyltransferase)
MAEIVRMPKLSDTMSEGVIAKWHKKVGEKVKSGDVLADIETDKATMEFESFQDGVLLHIGVQEKQAVPVDSVIAILGKEGEDVKSILASLDKPSNGNGKHEGASREPAKQSSDRPAGVNPAAAKPVPPGVEVVRMPKLSDTMTDGVVAKWHKQVGDKVKSGELLADIETDKATMEFESFQDGVLIHQGIKEGQSAPVNSVLAILGKGGEDVAAILATVEQGQKEPATPQTPQTHKTPEPRETGHAARPTAGDEGSRLKASPLAKALAREKGIDISQVKGSGENGRITKADIESYTPQKGGTPSSVPGKESHTDEPVSQMRRTIARRLIESKSQAPHFYLNIEVDMEQAIVSRNAINAIPDTKISFNDLIIKACAAAIRRHPKVNASWLGDKIRYYSHVHIGVAVAIDDGLLVPVVRFADQKSLSQISAEVKDLGKKARDRKLQPSDWEGNTFTVSNLGMFGIESFTSIINSPESCILSVGAIRNVPVVKNNMIVPGHVMKLTMACDHRTVDGATGAAFLQTLKAMIENPVTILV